MNLLISICVVKFTINIIVCLNYCFFFIVWSSLFIGYCIYCMYLTEYPRTYQREFSFSSNTIAMSVIKVTSRSHSFSHRYN